MNNETRVQRPTLHTLIPLADFKAILGLDDREDTLSRYCLITATYTIEQYCRRRLYLKRHFERIEFYGDLLLILREYPVRGVLAVYACYNVVEPELIEPEFYRLSPEIEERLDIPHTLWLSPALGRLPGLTAFKAVYRAGYAPVANGEWKIKNGKGGTGDLYGVPADLAAACLELAAWNMSRYRGKRIGMTGNIRGSGFATRGGADGEHLEMSMPENVKQLLEPYKRRVI
jgi:hypothetical protein